MLNQFTSLIIAENFDKEKLKDQLAQNTSRLPNKDELVPSHVTRYSPPPPYTTPPLPGYDNDATIAKDGGTSHVTVSADGSKAVRT